MDMLRGKINRKYKNAADIAKIDEYEYDKEV